MWILIVGLVLLAIVAMIAGYIRNKRLQKKIDNGELDSFPEVKEVDESAADSTKFANVTACWLPSANR